MLTRGYFDDEELGKKFDDPHRPPRTSTQFRPKSTSSSWKLPRRRRMLLVCFGICILYLLLKNIPTDFTPTTKPTKPTIPFNALHPRLRDDQLLSDGSSVSLGPPRGPPPNTNEIPSHGLHYYDGPIKFYSLAASLYSARGLRGYRRHNKIVVFAAADLQALSDLLPLACEMARQKQNRVHFAVMGRNDVSVEGMQMVNGVDAEECPLFWHDARPDYARWSTDSRMESSVMTGFSHINTILRPSLVITHGDRYDETFLWKAVKDKAARAGVPHIRLPARAADFPWMAILDSSSLGAWNNINVEILVHAPPDSSGSLTRLLDSLQGADYLGDTPRLTIELPYNVDTFLFDYLKSFKWPPNSEHSHFTLRRRIQPDSITPEEAAIRTIDSVYPKNSAYSHVLILSPQTELAPSYYHYLKYAILKYKYSQSTTPSLHRLLGISLELPSISPTDGKPFAPPTPSDRTVVIQDIGKEIPVFLWQAPNSNAALYFGDKWIEFQSFLSNRLATSRRPVMKKSLNLISKKFPSWMEYMLELIRARGYYLLYPAFPATTDTVLATTHNELYHLPEEHTPHPETSKPKPESGAEDLIASPNEPLTGSISSEMPQVELGSKEKPVGGSSTISSLLPLFPAGLPDLSSLHALPYSQEDNGSPDLVERAQIYLKEFRESIGGCDTAAAAGAQSPAAEGMHADDLFC
ncbi:hypothetical protein AJ78_06675 [Emergomyces pasteurianus Ep9510]|uniref:Uncharacterized protein n=1 Tax=Emergomyces pasteurianus Ep9510 TaxID=1447872 RepID=A0A1J9P820_9EURO|nr:hypothetical protein AJ78_06675 [Emergomyces pasteurianus Ep9510]